MELALEVVLEYLELCRRFWRLGQRELDCWKKLVTDHREVSVQTVATRMSRL